MLSNPYKTFFLLFPLMDWVKQLYIKVEYSAITLYTFEPSAKEGKLAIFLALGGRWNVSNHRTRKKSRWHYHKLIVSWRPTILDVIKAYLTSGCLIFGFIISTWIKSHHLLSYFALLFNKTNSCIFSTLVFNNFQNRKTGEGQVP